MVKRVRQIPKVDKSTASDGGDSEAKKDGANASDEQKATKPFETSNPPIAQGAEQSFNPLEKSVIEREYSTAKIDEAKVGEVTEEIPEPSFFEDPALQDDKETKERPPSPLDNPNEAFNELDSKDQKVAAESVVDMILDGYEQLHVLGQKYVEFGDMELAKMAIEGQYDLDMPVPVDENTSLPLREFVQSYNEQAKEPMAYDPEFGEKVRPVMVRVALKHGWGVTDEQYLMYMFGKDITVKIASAYSLRKQMKDTIYLITESAKRASPDMQERQAASAAQHSQKPPRTPETEFIEQEELTDEDLEQEEYLSDQESEHPRPSKFNVSANFGKSNPMSTYQERTPPRPKVKTTRTRAS